MDTNGHVDLRKLLGHYEDVAAKIRATLSAIDSLDAVLGAGVFRAGAVAEARVDSQPAFETPPPPTRKRSGKSAAQRARRAKNQEILDSFEPGAVVPRNTFVRLGPFLNAGYLKRKGDEYVRTSKPYEA